MPALNASGRIALAELVFNSPLHLGWGLGDNAWTSPPDVTGNEATLQAEVGRRPASQVAFVVPDAAGVIDLPEGKFSVSVAPTRHLYVRTDFQYQEANGYGIREIALFLNTRIQPGLPTGQSYFLPADVLDGGRLLYMRKYAPIYRFPNTRERFEIVLSF